MLSLVVFVIPIWWKSPSSPPACMVSQCLSPEPLHEITCVLYAVLDVFLYREAVKLAVAEVVTRKATLPRAALCPCSLNGFSRPVLAVNA